MIQYYQNSKAPTLAATYDATISSSTTLTLQTGTSTIAVSAVLKGIFMKWGATASSSAFDEYIPLDSTMVYVVPNDPLTGIAYTTVQFIEEAASAHLVVIEK